MCSIPKPKKCRKEVIKFIQKRIKKSSKKGHCHVEHLPKNIMQKLFKKGYLVETTRFDTGYKFYTIYWDK